MATFIHNDIIINYRVQGTGIPFLFLHGLGDNLEFSFKVFNKKENIQLICMDQRGHGKSSWNSDPLNYDVLAKDALALMNYLKIPRFYIGGLSMGAGVALNLAVHHSEKVSGLVLLRSSSTDKPMKSDVIDWFKTVSKYLPKNNEKELFEQDNTFFSIKHIYPRAIDTFERYFEDIASISYPEKFVYIPKDTPLKNKKELENLDMPVLILSSSHDYIHPIEYSQFLNQNIEQANYYEITSKTINATKQKKELDCYINTFILNITNLKKLEN